MTAVLVDDEYYALQGLKMELKGFAEIELLGLYEDGKIALEKIALLKPDLAFVDIDMPGMEGIEVFQKIEACSPQTKIIFITAYPQYARKAFDVGAVDYIIKPAGKERLAKTLKRLNI